MIRRASSLLAILAFLALGGQTMVPNGAGPLLVPGGTLTPNGGGAMVPGGGLGVATAAPTVTGLSPASGSTAGGNTVTVTGTQFIGVTSVHFGANSASFVVLGPTLLQATAPAHAAGVVDVTVTNPIGTSSTGAPDQYTYSSCTNSLDFSQACNSANVPAMFH